MDKIKLIKRYKTLFKNFNFTSSTPEEGDEFLEAIVSLNENGLVICEDKFDIDNELEEKAEYEYDGNGKVVSQTLLYALDDVMEKKIFKRDEKGNLLSEVKLYGE